MASSGQIFQALWRQATVCIIVLERASALALEATNDEAKASKAYRTANRALKITFVANITSTKLSQSFLKLALNMTTSLVAHEKARQFELTKQLLLRSRQFISRPVEDKPEFLIMTEMSDLIDIYRLVEQNQLENAYQKMKVIVGKKAYVQEDDISHSISIENLCMAIVKQLLIFLKNTPESNKAKLHLTLKAVLTCFMILERYPAEYFALEDYQADLMDYINSLPASKNQLICDHINHLMLLNDFQSVNYFLEGLLNNPANADQPENDNEQKNDLPSRSPSLPNLGTPAGSPSLPNLATTAGNSSLPNLATTAGSSSLPNLATTAGSSSTSNTIASSQNFSMSHAARFTICEETSRAVNTSTVSNQPPTSNAKPNLPPIVSATKAAKYIKTF